MAIYEQIGESYYLTRHADPYIVSRLNHYLRVSPYLSYLDIDQSQRMLAAAQKKSSSIFWQLADVTRLPYNEKTFSGVVCTLAIHHFISLAAAFSEIHRVMMSYWLIEYFPEAISQSAEQMPSLEVVNDALAEAGFHSIKTEDYFIQEDLQDFFLYSGKHRPAMYLDTTVRSGISTFAVLASKAEIEEGCRKLELDIKQGRIKDVIKKYEHSGGDYKFVIARKDAA